jgi:hypothetical protein
MAQGATQREMTHDLSLRTAAGGEAISHHQTGDCFVVLWTSRSDKFVSLVAIVDGEAISFVAAAGIASSRRKAAAAPRNDTG